MAQAVNSQKTLLEAHTLKQDGAAIALPGRRYRVRAGFLAVLLAAVPVVTMPPSVTVRLYECRDFLFPGAKQFQIDSGYLIKTRMMRDLPDDQTFAISELIRSDTGHMEVLPAPGYGQFRVRINGIETGTGDLVAWVSNRTRDGLCAIELEGSRSGRPVREFLQILAIYPDGSLALGLPNSRNRVGLIMLVNEAVPVRFLRYEADIFDVQAGA